MTHQDITIHERPACRVDVREQVSAIGTFGWDWTCECGMGSFGYLYLERHQAITAAEKHLASRARARTRENNTTQEPSQ